MFGPEKLTEELEETGPIDANSPMVYALARLAALMGNDKETAQAMAQLDAAGSEFAHAKESPSVFAFHRTRGPSQSIAEMASQMTADQWRRWMGEAPEIAKMLIQPKFEGMEGALVRAVVETAKAAGMKQRVAKAMILLSNLTWKDDNKATHEMRINGGARQRRSRP